MLPGEAQVGHMWPSNQRAVTEVRALTHHIKRVAGCFGADVIGIVAMHPSMIYSGSRAPDDGSTAPPPSRC